jgi:hypothetical protein
MRQTSFVPGLRFGQQAFQTAKTWIAATSAVTAFRAIHQASPFPA